MLRKHLPERYHVATGFIHKCPKQIDILIYDRLEYAPLFREGDLVVIDASAVRAVIEVKTDLGSNATLKDCLDTMGKVSALDDCRPPFFKGIFAFKASLQNPQDHVAKQFLTGPHNITEMYRHMTSLCVLEETYLQIAYSEVTRPEKPSDEEVVRRIVPRLRPYISKTELKIQAGLFLDELMVHLRVDSLKPVPNRQIRRLLQTDTRWMHGKILTDLNWGPYAEAAAGIANAADGVAEMEERFAKVEDWLSGESVDFT
ncbi:hypothetical protein LFL96_01035 [Paraburkholderia sp. D15]|uniref:DUF6602 domain-containing protein n=1 Tax=Paraburkholderia sp. D15 TaxID=2880218 RepID=UPI002478659C|nr:DUF6602 domain-containing protein [Paraburkholderia sp. D15]WGS50126.1 hypothetical protein LFL96_01035 [Paraburkholderia sp. D15]